MQCLKCGSKDCIKDGKKIGKKGRVPQGRCGGCGYRGPLEKFQEKSIPPGEEVPGGESPERFPPHYDPPFYTGTVTLPDRGSRPLKTEREIGEVLHSGKIPDEEYIMKNPLLRLKESIEKYQGGS